MSIEMLLTVGGAVAAIVGYMLTMKGTIEQMKKDMDSNFERHREEHQEHHKEIAKMFDGVSDKLQQHITEERVHNALAGAGQHCVHGKLGSECQCKKAGLK